MNPSEFGLELVGQVEGAAAVVAGLSAKVETKLALMADFVGVRSIDYLKSLTGEMRPSARRKSGVWTGPRQAHPGHWGDVENHLVNGYGWNTRIEGLGSVLLILYNTAEYAVYLDRREGFFVLRGITQPGGPVQLALHAALATLAPDWDVRSA